MRIHCSSFLRLHITARATLTTHSHQLTPLPCPPPCPSPLTPQVRIHRSSFLRLRITRKGDPHEAHFFNLLVEDKTPAGVSYVEFLCSIHKSIQQKLQ